MGLVIKRVITFDFLGEDYKDAYITFRSIPVGQLESVQKRLPTDPKAGAKIITAMVKILAEQFLDGKFPDENGKLSAISKADLDDLDADTALHCFKVVTGQDDPKAAG